MEKGRTREQEIREIREAIVAGEAALWSLKAAESSMDSASSWGIFDMFFGGLFSSMMKYGKIDKGQAHLEEARRRFLTFRKELKDVSDFQNMDFEIDGFMKFIDVWMDNFFMDWAVQSKISQSQEKIGSAIFRINQMLLDLKTKERELTENP